MLSKDKNHFVFFLKHLRNMTGHPGAPKKGNEAGEASREQV